LGGEEKKKVFSAAPAPRPVTAVIPYFGYAARIAQTRRVPITAKLFANLLEAPEPIARRHRSPLAQVPGFFDARRPPPPGPVLSITPLVRSPSSI